MLDWITHWYKPETVGTQGENRNSIYHQQLLPLRKTESQTQHIFVVFATIYLQNDTPVASILYNRHGHGWALAIQEGRLFDIKILVSAAYTVVRSSLMYFVTSARKPFFPAYEDCCCERNTIYYHLR